MMLSIEGTGVEEEDETIVKPPTALGAAVGRKALLLLLAFHLSLDHKRDTRMILFKTIEVIVMSNGAVMSFVV